MDGHVKQPASGTDRRSRTEKSKARQRQIELCNFRTAGQLSSEHAGAINSMHEGFARAVTNSLSAYLRVSFEMTLSSLEQLTYREYLSAAQDAGYLLPFRLSPLDKSGLLQVDGALAFAIIDVLLGGSGTAGSAPREMTEIDEDVMAGVARIVGSQLQTAWQALAVDVVLERCQKLVEVQETLPANERILLLAFAITMGETGGTLRLIFPATFAGALLRKAPGDTARRRPGVRYLPGPDMRQRLLNCDFDAALGISRLRVKVRDLISLKPGDVLPFPVPVTTPASLLLGGREIFGAAPVRNGNKRAGQLLQSVQPSPQPHDQLA
jgi:flagellar motor switch protein FliM